MNRGKLDKYNLCSSIHTFSVKSLNEPKIPDYIKGKEFDPHYRKLTGVWTTIVNPNKLDCGDIFAYSEFCANVQTLFNDAGIPDCKFYRTDIRVDSYEDNFKEYYKLNLLLISLFSIIFKDTNKQAVGHFLMNSKEFTDISTKNSYWEIKYYNKKFQTHDTDPTKARLEFRCLKLPYDYEYKPHMVKEKWFKKLDKVLSQFDKLQKTCNKELYKAYQDYCIYNEYKGSKDLLTKFFSIYANSMTMFSREQLRDFLKCVVWKRKQ